MTLEKKLLDDDFHAMHIFIKYS